MSASDFEEVEPRQLTSGDKVFLGIAFAVTLARVAGMLGVAFSFMFWAFSYAFEPSPSVTRLINAGLFFALYIVSSVVMHLLSKRTYR